MEGPSLIGGRRGLASEDRAERSGDPEAEQARELVLDSRAKLSLPVVWLSFIC